jgi:hypothetical protein
MHDDRLRSHIVAAGRPDTSRRLTSHILLRCWPGGPGDRSEPAALAWVALWRPERDAATIPVCSCFSGRCAVCN